MKQQMKKRLSNHMNVLMVVKHYCKNSNKWGNIKNNKNQVNDDDYNKCWWRKMAMGDDGSYIFQIHKNDCLMMEIKEMSNIQLKNNFKRISIRCIIIFMNEIIIYWNFLIIKYLIIY
jgi:hypothetical protein